MKRARKALSILAAALLCSMPTLSSAQPIGVGVPLLPGPLSELQRAISLATSHSPWRVGIAIKDLATGLESGVNADKGMPAASTIKIPVMVEVFRQMELGRVDLHRTIHVEESDKDYGSGDLCDATIGTPVTVEHLLWGMITDSDNTATNMLIRLVGRQHINQTMRQLGLRHTSLGDYIRTSSSGIRYALRTSPNDMIRLLDAMAHRRLVDPWASDQMLAILTGQHINTLLPEPLPAGTQIAHKTGSLHDTLNDVGIVYLDNEPYAIAVMTTNLPDLDSGRTFIRHVSRLAYDSFKRFAQWRASSGVPAFAMRSSERGNMGQTLAPDVAMWNSAEGTAAAPDVARAVGGGVWKNPNFVP